jgi:hypothetical protein
MDWMQFFIIVALLLWIVWRLPSRSSWSKGVSPLSLACGTLKLSCRGMRERVNRAVRGWLAWQRGNCRHPSLTYS